MSYYYAEDRRQCGRCFKWLSTRHDYTDAGDPYCRACMEASYTGPFWRDELGAIEEHPAFRAKSSDIWHALFEEQRGRCAICGVSGVSLVIDHDHETERVRGLLCSACNSGLGMFHDSVESLEAAKAYLIRNRQKPLRYLYAEAKRYARSLKETAAGYFVSKAS